MVFFILLFYIASAAAAADANQPCGPTDWFLYNLKHSVYQPMIDSFSYVLYPAAAMISQRKHFPHGCQVCNAFDKSQTEECGAIGVQGGMDVLHILFKIYSGGFTLPFLPFVTPLTYNATYLFDICTEHASKYDLEKIKTKEPVIPMYEKECFRASRLFQCATFNIHYLWPWLLSMIIVFVAGVILPITAFGCWYCC